MSKLRKNELGIWNFFDSLSSIHLLDISEEGEYIEFKVWQTPQIYKTTKGSLKEERYSEIPQQEGLRCLFHHLNP